MDAENLSRSAEAASSALLERVHVAIKYEIPQAALCAATPTTRYAGSAPTKLKQQQQLSNLYERIQH